MSVRPLGVDGRRLGLCPGAVRSVGNGMVHRLGVCPPLKEDSTACFTPGRLASVLLNKAMLPLEFPLKGTSLVPRGVTAPAVGAPGFACAAICCMASSAPLHPQAG